MRLTYRVAGLVATFSLVAAFLATSGFVCVGPDATSHMAAMSMDMTGMDMSGMDMRGTAPERPADSRAPGAAHLSEAPPVECDFPWAPAGCRSMAPCGPVADAASRVSLTAVRPAVFRISSASPLQPPSETIAPELPPPRA